MFKKIIEELKEYVPLLDKDKQVVQAMEECGELIQALAKEINDKPRDKNNIKEEIADVMIMVTQMMIYFSNENEIKWYMEHKLQRIKDYLERIGKINNER